MTTLDEALTKIIDIGIEAAKQDYAGPERTDKRTGAIRGFNECRNKTPDQLADLLFEANTRAVQAQRDQASNYWYWRCRASEIEWVANVVSSLLMNQGRPIIVPPTARGVLMADRVMKLMEGAA
jgi:hypothetical protein